MFGIPDKNPFLRPITYQRKAACSKWRCRMKMRTPEMLPALLFVRVLFVLFLLFVLVLSGEPKQNQGRVLVDRKLF